MPTGLKDSPEAAPGPGLAQAMPRAAINRTILLTIAATNTPQTFTGLIVSPGASVSLRGDNGTTTGNAKNVFVARNREALTGAGASTITPDTEISYPVDRLNQIWVQGTAGDGVIASVRGGAVQ